ncbi:chaperone protein dnaJ [Striga asiatica]|uniref:Chaperone protein dnaJ n=1 Tax=Striga asiatica TaxID=4170 RepID=A0A5A7QPP5_STRAF|nr:chaperone protein dnaJ [Striga asiatica]
MDCNRDEALRAKEIAERKFLAKDIKGARKFALKAQKIYPELDGISQMLLTLNVYISAEDEKLHGESNWYGVLGVTPVADDETIRKQYRKLALLLHPDKNRSIGAEGAFQIVSQAWSLLSDKHKKAAYDQRCRAAYQYQQQQTDQTTRDGFYNFANSSDSQMRASNGNKNNYNNNNVGKNNSSSVPNPTRKKERRTFWTVCHRCKMQYEYLRMYLNHNLLCPNCHEAYFAVEIDPPSTKISKAPSLHAGSSQQSNPNTFQWVPFSESTDPKAATQAASMVRQAYEKVKRDRHKTQAAARKEEALRRKNHVSSKRPAEVSFVHSDFAKKRKGVDDCGSSKVENMKRVNSEGKMLSQANFSRFKRENLQKCTNKRDRMCRVNIKCLLMEKAHEQICEKLNECIPTTVVSKVAGVDVGGTCGEDKTANAKDNNCSAHGSICNPIVLCESEESQLPPRDLAFVKAAYQGSELVEKMSVDVLDPDFYDFDKGRTEKCFLDNQVWAVYDDLDGMPRHYAMIQSVISVNPFMVKMSWLRSVTHNKLGHVNWFSNGFSMTCGEFKVGRAENCDSVDCFSHVVRWTKQCSKTVQIFPRKGDVWALYRNWSAEWNELTECEVIYKYDMVEVLEDCDEEFGVIVIPLVKVAGFKAVFHQSLDPNEIRRIPKQEMARFSHQVPCHSLTGKEGSKSLRGCLELDPAAIPSDFLKVLSKIEEIELVESGDEQLEFVEAAVFDGNAIPNTVERIS